MPLAIRRGVPARTSTSIKSLTMRASRACCLSVQDKIRQVSPMTAKGVRPST